MKAFCCVFIFFCSVCFCSNESYWDLKLKYSQDELRIQAAQVNLSRFDPNYQEKYDRLRFALKELELKQRELEVNYQLDQLNGWKGPESQKYEAEKKLLAYKRKLAELEVFQKTVNSSVSSDLAMQQLALQEEMIQNTPMPQVGQPRSRQTRIRPSYVSVGHRAGRGVGYKKGYSSAALFLTPSWNRLFQPFLDFRGHVFNDGRMASNLGAGIRFISENEMAAFGVNIYHDFRSTHDLHAHQLGVGLEGLGRYFDFRVNGYFPIANDVKSHKIEFDQFVGNFIQFKRRVKIAIPSVNAEIGVPIPGTNCRKINLYLAASPYYLFGKRVNQAKFSNAFGWKGRLSAKLFDRLSLEVVVSHDHIFHTRAQGYASYSIPLGRKPKDFKASTCAKDAFIARTKAPAMRNEIIPMKKKEPRFFLKDAGGDNLFVIFVNNLAGCPGAGIFLDPFCTLALGEASDSDVDLIATALGQINIKQSQAQFELINFEGPPPGGFNFTNVNFSSSCSAP